MPTHNPSVKTSFEQIIFYPKRHEPVKDWHSILDDGDRFVKEAEKLLDAGKAEDAASIAMTWLYCFGKKFNEDTFEEDEEGFVCIHFSPRLS